MAKTANKDESTTKPQADPIQDAPETPASNNDVFVFAAITPGQAFMVRGKRVVIGKASVEGYAGVSKFSCTRVDKGDWDEILRLYGKMKMFSSGHVFSAPTYEDGSYMARERSRLRHGLEPVDVKKTVTEQYIKE
jgi:hypothetical protein